MTRGQSLSTPMPQRHTSTRIRKSRFLSSEERRALKRKHPHCPVCVSTRIHVYAERWAGGKPTVVCRACNRLFSLD